ncbi:hypothetical protein Tco_1094700 [Tanacetum coccineum]|uniref:Uncharacterized protein n=1 Tax=Tanacetum coccineum TaxID=301880 RepID=A0ABQ5IGD5_9ASTR
MCMFALTVSIVEPKNIKEAMADSAWIEAMQDELHQFDRLKEEGIDFKESFAPVARLEAVRIFVAYGSTPSLLSNLSDGRKTAFLMVHWKEEVMLLSKKVSTGSIKLLLPMEVKTAQRSRFLRYIDTKPNGEGLKKSILSGPYVPSTVLVQVVAATEDNLAIQQHTTIETVLNMTPENKENFLSKKEAIFLLLTGIGDDIYSTVDACKTSNWYWKETTQTVMHATAANDMLQPLKDYTRVSSEEDQCIYPSFDATSVSKVLDNGNSNKTEDTTPRYNNDNPFRAVWIERTMDSLGNYGNWIDEQELEAHYSFMAKIQEKHILEQPESINDTYDLEKDDSNVHSDSSNIVNNDNQENKTILKQLKKANASLTQELEECRTNLDETGRALGYGLQVVGIIVLLHFRTNRMRMKKDLKAQMQDKNIAISELKKLIENCKGKSVETQFDKPSIVRQPNAQKLIHKTISF